MFAAALSPTGGSAACAALLSEGEGFVPLVSGAVMREALGNLRLKGTPDGVARFYVLLGDLRAELVEHSDAEHRDLPTFIAPKDRHVIAACLVSGANVCLTLDRRHLLTDEIRRWGMGVGLRLLTPGELLAWTRLDRSSG